jgi:hypothetical protein
MAQDEVRVFRVDKFNNSFIGGCFELGIQLFHKLLDGLSVCQNLLVKHSYEFVAILLNERRVVV